jgi:hypothetical protein
MELLPNRSAGYYEESGWNFGYNGRISQAILFKKQAFYKFTCRMKGHSAQNVWPTLQLNLDNYGVGEKNITHIEFDTLSFIAAVDSGWHEVSLAFTNYYSDSLETRALIGDWLRIEYLRLAGIAENETNQMFPKSLKLEQNFPNPANPETMIKYHLPEKMLVRLKIFNVFGQEVRLLVNSIESTGTHSVLWDGRNNGGQSVVSGIYFYKLEAGDQVRSRKLIILK